MYLCGFECAIEYKQKQEIKQARKEKKKAKEQLMTYSDWLNKLQPVINKLARTIDKDHNCMMCNKPMKKVDGCHYHSVGSKPALRFNLLNIWAGCHSCNTMKGGNLHGYDEQLIRIYGRMTWEYLKFGLPKEYSILKPGKEQIKQAIKKAREITREIEKIDKKYDNEKRLELRKKYNKILGFYI